MTSKGYSLITTLVLLIFIFPFSSCDQKKQTVEKPSKKIDFKIEIPKDKEIKYNIRISNQGGIFIKKPDPGKSEHHPEDIKENYLITFKGMENGRICLTWKYFQINPDSGKKTAKKLISLKINDRMRAKNSDNENFETLLEMLFPIPDKPVEVNQVWEKKPVSKGGQKGFIRSSVIGYKTYKGRKCIHIKTEFDLLGEKENDFFRIEGSGTAYYSVKGKNFIDSNCKYSMRSKLESGGEELRIELMGNIEASLIE